MANPAHVALLKESVAAWNDWRTRNPGLRPDLSHASLAGIDFTTDLHVPMDVAVDFRAADLRESDLSEAILIGADLREADLSGATLMRAQVSLAHLEHAWLVGANLYKTDFRSSDLSSAKLMRAGLVGADLGQANLTGASLTGADLREAILIKTTLYGTDLRGCRVHGISVWGIDTNDSTQQSDLIITDFEEPTVRVDDLDVAQFIYLLINRQKLRNVLDTITSKAVLLLGRFTLERKAVLEALADELRKLGLLPVIFDFERSTSRDFTETIRILAGLSLFVVVDLTKPRSAPQELTATVPDYQIPFVPILEEGEEPYSMFGDLLKYDWVLRPVVTYRTKETLASNFESVILKPAWKKHQELQRRKNAALETMSIEQLLERNG